MSSGLNLPNSSERADWSRSKGQINDYPFQSALWHWATGTITTGKVGNLAGHRKTPGQTVKVTLLERSPRQK